MRRRGSPAWAAAAGLVLGLALAGGACGGGCRGAGETGPAAPPVRADGGAPAGTSEQVAEDAGPPVLEAAAAGAAREAAAVPAWTAVSDRARLLARRGGHGAVVGQVAAERGQGYPWLLDETRGAAGLGIRLGFAAGRTPDLAAGERLLVFGAWTVDSERRWVWRVDRALRLPPAHTSSSGAVAGVAGAARPSAGPHAPPASRDAGTSPTAAPPGSRDAGTSPTAAPPGSRDAGTSPTAAPPGSRDAGASAGPTLPLPADQLRTAASAPPASRVFYVLAPPVRTGDGWTIADSPRGPPVAHLLLPGEREPYGGQDYLSPDERWHLDRRSRYAVPIIPRRYPPHLRAGELPVLRAAAPPVEVLH